MKKLQIEKGSVLLIAALVMGVLLLVFSGGFSSEEKDDENKDYELLEKRCEERLKAMIKEIKGTGDVSVLVTLDDISGEKERPHVRGVAVVLSGNESAELRLRVVQLVSCAFGITSDKIFVTFS